MINFKLWKHQEEAVKRAINMNDYALLFDCGTGKSLTTIQIIRSHFAKAGSVLPTLILAPVIVLQNWKDEIQKFSNIPLHRVGVLTGNTNKRVKAIKEMRKQFGQGIILVTNYEALVSSPPFFKELFNWGPKILVIDESQRIKNHSSKRSKLVTKLADQSENRYLLTGTPILNSPMDIFSQYRALDGGETFGKNFFSFRARYFFDKNANMPKQVHFPDWQPRTDRYPEMQDLIYSKASRAVKSECLDLPPLIKKIIRVQLPPKVRAIYKSMFDHFITSIDESVVTADIALTKMLRLLQISSGFLPTEEGNKEVHSCKKDALKEILDEIHSKVIVWAVFKENYSQIREVCDKLKIKYVEAHGEITTQQKYNAVFEFNNDPSIKVFIGHPGSLGVGINLVAADYMVYFSRTYNVEHDIQSEARNYRGGSEVHSKITRIDIVAEDTIDEDVLSILQNKITDSSKIIDIIKSK